MEPDFPQEVYMTRYLFEVKYTVAGLQGLLKEGGSKRMEATQALAKSVGGRIESFNFAFGETDLYVVGEMPDNASASAVALTVGASGMAQVKTIVLLSPEEVDQASKKVVAYRPPGQ
jgi:uncharacterized protein with GYD domain